MVHLCYCCTGFHDVLEGRIDGLWDRRGQEAESLASSGQAVARLKSKVGSSGPTPFQSEDETRSL